jgi:hypothetical protein
LPRPYQRLLSQPQVPPTHQEDPYPGYYTPPPGTRRLNSNLEPNPIYESPDSTTTIPITPTASPSDSTTTVQVSPSSSPDEVPAAKRPKQETPARPITEEDDDCDAFLAREGWQDIEWPEATLPNVDGDDDQFCDHKH